MTPQTLGLMLDCSRNGVMKPEKVKEFARMMADMGYNMLQLYTETTYEVEDEPFFGYMRGRYTVEELQDIDAYCQSIGIELIPCIQTLAHFEHLTRFECYEPYFDCTNILLIGDEKVYELIDKMFAACAKAFSSRRIHIGMDEAHFVGLGKYLDQHGFQNRNDIMLEHLRRVKEIADRYGFRPMMWADMFMRLNNGGDPYPEHPIIPQETIDGVPEGIELVYWDYYSADKKRYDTQLDAYAKFPNKTAFAGGIWTWVGFVPCSEFSLAGSEAAMRSVHEHDVDTVMFTLWGDDGKECSFWSVLPAIFAAAQFAKGNFDRADIAARFEAYTGYTFDEFMALGAANEIADPPTERKNPAKYLLYNDPFIGLLDKNTPPHAAEQYAALAERIASSINGRPYDYVFDVIQKLCAALSIKADLGIRIRTAYAADDRASLEAIATQEIPTLIARVESLYAAVERMWYTENKGFGFEIQEARFGALLQRLKGCAARLRAYLCG